MIEIVQFDHAPPKPDAKVNPEPVPNLTVSQVPKLRFWASPGGS